MKTRTLLVLSAVVGTLILVAGIAQLVRIGTADSPAPALAVGASATAGDVTVTVDGVETVVADDGAAQLRVAVTVGGADDADGFTGFFVVGTGVTKALSVDVEASTCRAIAVAPATCTLAFDVTGLANGTRQLVWQRAGDQVRWSLG